MSKKQKEQRLVWLAREIYEQRRWIGQCEANEVSYADGERGQNIRRADEATLADYLSEYKELRLEGIGPRLHHSLAPR